MAQTSFIHANQGVLFAEDVSLETIANQFGTPTYIYSKNTLIQTFESFKKGLLKTNHLVCFAVKANSNIAILNLFASLGAGFDIVSGGELERVGEIVLRQTQLDLRLSLKCKHHVADGVEDNTLVIALILRAISFERWAVS